MGVTQTTERGLRDWQSSLLKRSSEVDRVVKASASLLVNAPNSPPLAVAAVGGYGRQELFPYSDVDLLIAVRSEDDLDAIKAPLADVIRTLWDSGLRVSQSTRTLAECCQLNETNIELHISLLDCRYVMGDRSIFDELTQNLASFYKRHGQTLVRSLSELTRSRHSKYNHTIFHLEPNVKETPGGIRDIHFLHWLSALLPENEALAEARIEAEDARTFFYPLRCFLHQRGGRDSNLLTFDLQDEAAAALDGGADPAEWMRRYFLFARGIWQAVQRALEFTSSLDRSLLRQFRERRSRLSTADYTIVNDRIFLRNPTETIRGAAPVLDLFTFSARHGVPLAWDAQRRLRAASAQIVQSFASDPPGWTSWGEFFRQPHTGLALHEMQETGVLNAAIPEWEAVDGLVVRDFYHRYTVDEHTLVAIGVIDELVRGAEGTAKRLHHLLKELDDIAVLQLALLMHDIGKGTDPGDHVTGSIRVAEAVMRRFQLPPEYERTVLFLIEHHLDLSLIMNGRDLDDPATGRLLASKTQTIEQLRYLTLLTYADISAVNPTAMTPWRVEQLWRAYVLGQEQLTRDLNTDRIGGPEDLPPDERTPQLARFLKGLPTRYIRTHTADEVRRHCEMQIVLREKKVAVDIFPRSGAYQATVLAVDKPGLFASLCGALASFGLNIVKAEAFTNESGLVVDQFRFTDPLRNLELNPSEIDRLRKSLERVVLGTEDVRLLLKRRRPSPRPARVAQIAPVVRFSNDASDEATLIDFVGEDRPGLLYDLASVIAEAGCNIEIVLIDTEAHKAIDVFYITCGGEKLTDDMQQKLQLALMRAAEGPTH